MRKDTIVGIAFVVFGFALLWFCPLLGIIAVAVMGPVMGMGFWLLLNSRRKRKADRLSDDKGRCCYGKVLRIEPYVTETGLAQTVASVKRVLVCIYDDVRDRFVNVADIMDEKEIKFKKGDFISVTFFTNDFNYISTVSELDSIPESIRDNFLNLIGHCNVTVGNNDADEVNKPDTTGWTVTEEAYSDGMHLMAGQEQILASDDDILINALINYVETVSAIKDYDIGESRRFAIKTLFLMIGLFTLLSAIFCIWMMYMSRIR